MKMKNSNRNNAKFLPENLKTLIILFTAVFLSFTGASLVVPLLPAYAHKLGVSGLGIGLIIAALPLSNTITILSTSSVSDKKGRKPFIVAGLFIYGFAAFGFAFFQIVLVFILLRLIQGIAAAIMIPNSHAYIAELIPKGKESLIMGILNAVSVFGYGAGPIMGGIIADKSGMNMAFICTGTMVLAGAFLTLFGLPPVNKEKRSKENSDSSTNDLWKKIIKDKETAGIIFVILVVEFCIVAIWTVLPILADTVFQVSVKHIGLLVSAAVLMNGIVSVPAGWLGDRFSKKKMIICGGLLMALSVSFMEHAGSYSIMLAANVLLGISQGIVLPCVRALAVSKGNQTKAMTSVMGALTIGQYIGMMLGALIAGTMMDIWGTNYIFYVCAALTLVATLFFANSQRK